MCMSTPNVSAPPQPQAAPQAQDAAVIDAANKDKARRRSRWPTVNNPYWCAGCHWPSQHHRQNSVGWLIMAEQESRKQFLESSYLSS